MFVRKKTKLAFAYGLLAASALGVTSYDAWLRNAPPVQRAPLAQEDPPVPAPLLGITPIAASPFPEARPHYFHVGRPVLSQKESTEKENPGNRATPPGTYFLTVAVQVNSGPTAVAFNRGTRVRLLGQQDGKLRVTRNGTDFLIEKSQVTDDLNALTTLARNSS